MASSVRRPTLGERHAEGIELGFEPSGSGAEDHPPAAELVDGGDRLGHHDTGPRIGKTSTVVPMRTRDVAAATQDITANGSRTYADGGYGTPAGTTRWSLTQTSANPSSSASRAVRVRASPEAAGPACGRWTPPVIDADSVIAGTVQRVTRRRHSTWTCGDDRVGREAFSRGARRAAVWPGVAKHSPSLIDQRHRSTPPSHSPKVIRRKPAPRAASTRHETPRAPGVPPCQPHPEPREPSVAPWSRCSP